METRLPTEPTIAERAQQPYVAVRERVTMQTFSAIADRLPEVFGWLNWHGVEPAGPPFFRYNLIDMDGELEVEAGVPVDREVTADGPVLSGILPAGRYATLTHVGHPDGLLELTTTFLDWAGENGLHWDMRETDQGQRWGCRLERLMTDPAEQPDLNQWVTELAFRLAD